MSALIIEEARSEDDQAISTMAEEAGLKLAPALERERDHARLFVARLKPEGTAVGFVLAWIVVDELEVLDVCVHVEQRRLGIGARLIGHLLREASQVNVKTAFLEVRRSNVAAQALYARFGFEPQGERERYYSDGEDALIFRCCLAPRT